MGSRSMTWARGPYDQGCDGLVPQGSFNREDYDTGKMVFRCLHGLHSTAGIGVDEHHGWRRDLNRKQGSRRANRLTKRNRILIPKFHLLHYWTMARRGPNRTGTQKPHSSKAWVRGNSQTKWHATTAYWVGHGVLILAPEVAETNRFRSRASATPNWEIFFILLIIARLKFRNDPLRYSLFRLQ